MTIRWTRRAKRQFEMEILEARLKEIRGRIAEIEQRLSEERGDQREWQAFLDRMLSSEPGPQPSHRAQGSHRPPPACWLPSNRPRGAGFLRPRASSRPYRAGCEDLQPG